MSEILRRASALSALCEDILLLPYPKTITPKARPQLVLASENVVIPEQELPFCEGMRPIGSDPTRVWDLPCLSTREVVFVNSEEMFLCRQCRFEGRCGEYE